MAELDEVATLTVQGESEGVDKVVTDLNRVSEAQTKVGATAEASATVQETAANKLNQSQAALSGSYDRLMAKLDSAYAAQLKFQSGQGVLDKAFAGGVINAEQYAAVQSKLEASLLGINTDAKATGGTFGWLAGMFGASNAETGRHNETLKMFRETVHTVDPALKGMGVTLGGITQFTGAARGGFVLLAGAIGGALTIALAKAGDEAKIASQRFADLLNIGGKADGGAVFAGLEKAAEKLGTDVSSLTKPMESLIGLTQKFNSFHFVAAPGMDQFLPMTQNVNGLVRALTTLDEMVKVGGATDAAAQKEVAAFFSELDKGGKLTAGMVQTLQNESPAAANALAKAFNKTSVADFEAALGKVPASAQSVMNALQRMGADADARFADWKEHGQTAADSIGDLVTAFTRAWHSVAEGSGAVKELSGWLDDLAKHPEAVIKGFEDFATAAIADIRSVIDIVKELIGLLDQAKPLWDAIQPPQPKVLPGFVGPPQAPGQPFSQQASPFGFPLNQGPSIGDLFKDLWKNLPSLITPAAAADLVPATSFNQRAGGMFGGGASGPVPVNVVSDPSSAALSSAIDALPASFGSAVTPLSDSINTGDQNLASAFDTGTTAIQSSLDQGNTGLTDAMNTGWQNSVTATTSGDDAIQNAVSQGDASLNITADSTSQLLPTVVRMDMGNLSGHEATQAAVGNAGTGIESAIGGLGDTIGAAISSKGSSNNPSADPFANPTGQTGTLIPHADINPLATSPEGYASLAAQEDLQQQGGQINPATGKSYTFQDFYDKELAAAPATIAGAKSAANASHPFLNSGTDVTFTGSGGPDSIFLPLHVSPGERLIVLPAGMTGSVPQTGLPGSLAQGGFGAGLSSTGSFPSLSALMPSLGDTHSAAGLAPSAAGLGPTTAPASPLGVGYGAGPPSGSAGSPGAGYTSPDHPGMIWIGAGLSGGTWIPNTLFSGTAPLAFASGVDTVIPGSGPPDSVALSLRVSPGERLIVLPPDKAGLVPDLGLPGMPGTHGGSIYAAAGADVTVPGGRGPVLVPPSNAGGGVVTLADLRAVVKEMVDKMAENGPTPISIGPIHIASGAHANAQTARQFADEVRRGLAAQQLRPR